jgi:hypothetical protein
MNRYWRLDAPIGHNCHNDDDARQVAVVLHYAFLACNVIHSTILSNNIRCIEVYERVVNCHNHGKDRNVFVLIQSTDAVRESHIVSFLATQFLSRCMIRGVKDGIGKFRFSMISRTKYESVQVAYKNDIYSRNGNMNVHAT